MTNHIYFFSTLKNDYQWLSNFYHSPFTINNETYQTNEHWYQSNKALYEQDRKIIISMSTPLLAMKVGRNIEQRADWNSIKVEVMRIGLREKFTQNKDLGLKLIETKDAILHESSPSDRFWGIKGKDILGKLLMELREKIRSLENV
jgi:N-glycosidase YbiA